MRRGPGVESGEFRGGVELCFLEAHPDVEELGENLGAQETTGLAQRLGLPRTRPGHWG